ncbi:MAG: hypothetical protein ACHRXM_22095 [Isosphaerales bacterium]
MPVTHVNRKRDTYYLHAGTTKTGKPRYWFAKSAEGDLVESIPEGYEIYENPDAQVFVRKIVPQLVTPAEVAVVQEGVKRYAPGQNCVVDVQKEHIVVHHAERANLDFEGFGFGLRELPTYYGNYMKIMRFTLVDEKDRTFRVQRWCFRGSIDDWIDLWVSGSEGKLSDLVKRFCPHIGQESFFELM